MPYFTPQQSSTEQDYSTRLSYCSVTCMQRCLHRLLFVVGDRNLISPVQGGDGGPDWLGILS
jgi:hypothetical protein